ncbi:ATP-binding protein [Methylosinus sporium]|uniref:ATP-binding protein n=1 Tax=Methylosinus sporium TaxID=428 RepID=UPI00383B129D
MAEWGFYGRRVELAEIDKILARRRFFFCAISGRRRIGKTSLIQEAIRRRGLTEDALYVQVPDSDERGVVQAFEDSIEDVLDDQEFARKSCANFSEIAILLFILWKNGWITALDEFQYFHRKALAEFQSHLQTYIDRARTEESIGGGLFTLGSIHTEMTAILEDRASPLFNRVTDRLDIGHWDFETLFEMFRSHDISDPRHRLFLWCLFEGVPKFYRDCFDQGVLKPIASYRSETLRTMFFEGSSPLKDEADNWFLRELRGRYDTVLTLLARLGPLSHGQLRAEYDRAGPAQENQLAGYLKVLIEKYGMVEKLQPILSADRQRNARYVIADNFLSAWLAAIQRNVRLARIRPIEEAVAKADVSLQTHEGYAFEKLVRQITEECSRKGVGDFPLTELVAGYWNKADGSDIEIDMIALDETNRRIRFGSCKRSASAHDMQSLASFEEHVARFLATKTGAPYRDWRIEKAVYAPIFSSFEREALGRAGMLCVDMDDFERWLTF